MNIQMQGGYLKKNYTDLLGPFRKDGDNKSKQLLETLETFVLDAGMNSGKTAEFMGNTHQHCSIQIKEDKRSAWSRDNREQGYTGG